MGPRRGLSLAEVMVTTGLMGILLIGVARVTVSGHQYYRRYEATVDVQRNALLALNWIGRELAEGNPDSMRVDTSPHGLVFATPRDEDGEVFLSDRTNLIEWRGIVCYYQTTRDGEGVLVRKHEALSPPRALPPLDLLPTRSVAWFLSQTAIQERVVARSISEFSVSGTDPVALSVTAEVKSGGKFRIILSTKISLKN